MAFASVLPGAPGTFAEEICFDLAFIGDLRDAGTIPGMFRVNTTACALHTGFVATYVSSAKAVTILVTPEPCEVGDYVAFSFRDPRFQLA